MAGQQTIEVARDALDDEVNELTLRLAEIDRNIAQARRERRQVESAIQRVRSARRVLTGRPARPARQRTTPVRPPEKLAGPGVVRLVQDYFAKHGTATQHQVIQATRKSSGSISHAFQALVNAGIIRKTTEKIGHAPVYVLLADARRLAGGRQ